MELPIIHQKLKKISQAEFKTVWDIFWICFIKTMYGMAIIEPDIPANQVQNYE